MNTTRRCRFETVEPRRLLAVDPLTIGAVYIETDDGADRIGDVFEVTFEGGAPGTELTRLVIDGDQAQPGFSVNDAIFDTEVTGIGKKGAVPFDYVLNAADPTAKVTGTVVDGTSELILEFTNFRAGDTLTVTIDVDEVLPGVPGISQFKYDEITSGAEFEGSTATATFAAPHYQTITGSDFFIDDDYQNAWSVPLNLPVDEFNGKEDRTAGASFDLQQIPLPVSIAGSVYLEMNLDLRQDTGEPGLSGVELSLWRKDGGAFVDTGHTATTNASGHYEFGTNLNLLPGTYQVREVQPNGLFSVGAIPGQVDGTASGQTVAGDPNVLTEIEIPFGGQQAVNYDFAEAQPAAIGGTVYLDRDNDGQLDTNEPGISGVEIVVVPVDTVAAQAIVTTVTDAQGRYSVTGLAPGTYQVFEPFQPTGLFDGVDQAGTVNGIVSGTAVNPGDQIDGIFLGGGKTGVEYNFGEIEPASIRGQVHRSDEDGNCFGASATTLPLAGVAVVLNDATGGEVARTTTNINGEYEFTNLRPGTYTVVETTPVGFVDGDEHAGSAGGVISANDTISQIQLDPGEDAVEYDFCEHEAVSISGYVYHDRDNDGDREPGEEGLADVPVLIAPVDTFAAQDPVVVLTDVNGHYEATGLSPGEYQVVEQVQPAAFDDGIDTLGTVAGVTTGVLAGNDRFQQVRLTHGQRGVDYNFGEIQLASIQGSVHLSDPFGNCFTAGVNHTPLAGVTIQLLNEAGQVIETTTTATDGTWSFDDLLPGVYTVVEVTPAGFVDGDEHVGSKGGVITTNDTISHILLSSGDDAVDYDFCEHEEVSISGYVYHDRDNDGNRESGEEGIAGVPVLIAPVNTFATQDPVVVLTDANGRYEATGLSPGEYRVIEEVQPAGFVDGIDTLGTVAGITTGVLAGNDQFQQIRLTHGQHGVDYNFGEIQLASIHGDVHLSDPFGDCFTDGVHHPPLAGVTIQLLNETGQVIDTTTTAADGTWSFINLLPGVYSVLETTPPGLIDGDEHAGSINGITAGTATDDAIRDIRLLSGESSVDNQFCEHAPGSLSGFVYHDRNNNGVREGGEEGIGGTVVKLLDPQGAEIARTATNNDGSYAFTGLAAGTFMVMEVHPDGWLDGQDAAGTIDGVTVGQAANPGDKINEVVVRWGDDGVNYNFGELLAGSISGIVHMDPNQDCHVDPTEQRLAGVQIELLDANGNVIATTQTDNAGRYRFDGLAPGRYSIREIQPNGALQAGERADAFIDPLVDNVLRDLDISSGENLVNHNFCEIPPASIAGFVHVDPDGDCFIDPAEVRLSGVTIQLLDANNNVVATTQTAADGSYRFEGLRPGTYAVRESQPLGYFDGGQVAGQPVNNDAVGGVNGGGGGGLIGRQGLLDPQAANNPGDTSQPNLIFDIALAAGDDLTHYNFCETPPAAITGFVFQDGAAIETPNGEAPEDVAQLRNGEKTDDDTPLPGVVLELRSILGTPIQAANALPGIYPPGPIRVVTDASGFYEFTGLRAGTYNVYEVHPNAYIDGIDTAGSTGGRAVNPGDVQANLNPLFVNTLSQLTLEDATNPRNDAILLISLSAGQQSQLNNFSEVLVTGEPDLIPPPRIPVPPGLAPPPEVGFIPPPLVAPPVVPLNPVVPVVFITGSDSSGGFTWHLSIIDAGAPRHTEVAEGEADTDVEESVWRTSFLNRGKWATDELNVGRWKTSDDDSDEALRRYILGIAGGIPVAGDFNGDGVAEVGVFLRGEWFLDLNGNGRWDNEDLWARLGSEEDRPVVGDWNGDGKDDIGIFGPMWPRDPQHMKNEPGMPDPDNRDLTRPKNEPLRADEAAGVRHLKRSQDGLARSHAIDHVFHYGDGTDIPVAGDWNGDGIDTAGVFRNGIWRLDVNGDGKHTSSDRVIEFGQPGDIPVVGDFNGDGVDEVGIFRDGYWVLDSNNDHRLDAAHDRVFELGGPGDLPVVGDWNGDGQDEPGIYNESTTYEVDAEDPDPADEA